MIGGTTFFVAAVVVLALGAAAGLDRLAMALAGSGALGFAFAHVTAAGIAGAVLWRAARRWDVRARPLSGGRFVIGVCAAAAALGLSLAIAAPLGGWTLAPARADPAALAALAIGWAAHGFVEEALFRGGVQGAAQARLGPRAGAILGAVAWAMFQAWQGYGGPIALAVSFAVGVGLGLLWVRFGLWASVGAHAAWGFIELELFGPSGVARLAWTHNGDSANAPAFLIAVLACLLAGLIGLRRQRSPNAPGPLAPS